MFLWIPPVAYRYPERKATEVKALKLKINVTSVAFISGYITKQGNPKKHTVYQLPTTGLADHRERGRRRTFSVFFAEYSG